MSAPSEVTDVMEVMAEDSAPALPGSLPPDIAPDPQQVAALKAQAGSSGKPDKAVPSAKAGTVIAAMDFRINQYGRLVYFHSTPHGKCEVIDADAPAALDYIALEVAKATGTAPSHEVLKREIGPIRARCREEGRKVYVHNRIAPDGNGGYIVDLGNNSGEVVHVTAVGWTKRANASIAFRRGGGYGELHVPPQQETPQAAWDRVAGWLVSAGVKAETAPIAAVLLCEWLRSDTPNPIAEIIGAAGSGKTTLASHLAATVDPTAAGSLPSTKLQESDVAAAASNRYVIGYDNAGGPLVDAEQDLCCKVATGTVFAARLLYTQGEEFQIEARAPIIITAIVPVITRADARSRTVRITVSRRKEFAGAGDVESAFKGQRAELTGGLLTLLSAGLAGLPAARALTYTHRLVDFEQLGEAITAAVGWQPGQFQEAMRKHRREAAEEQAEISPIVVAVREAIAYFGAKAQPGIGTPPVMTWAARQGYAYTTPSNERRVGVMLKELRSRARTDLGALAYSSERATRNALEAQAPTLAALGITYGVSKTRDGTLLEFRQTEWPQV
jgi:energy-coupling factor transporter ATP-binding protein EcfA2